METKIKAAPKKKVIKLTREELRIYKSIVKSFPSISRDAALNYALQGGCKFDFKYK